MYWESNVSYRPKVANDLVERVEELLANGIAKSYSLVLTCSLLASGKYFVTIIPDCQNGEFQSDFGMFLLQSVGVDLPITDSAARSISHRRRTSRIS